MSDAAPLSLLTEQPLAGKHAFVTGGAAGIGRAVCIRLAQAGAAIELADRDEQGLRETHDLITKAGGAATVHVVDLSRPEAVIECVEQVLGRPVTIDILVNCAGITGTPAPLLKSDEQAWETVFAVNVRAPYLLIKRIGQQMVDRGKGGRIVNITSSSAHRARMSLPAYGASKAALMQLTRSAAAELGSHDINVNAVAPGLTATRMVTDNFDEESLRQALREGPTSNLLGRVSQPDDIAGTVLFLCLPASRQITGQTIHVSGGAVI